MIDFYFVFFSNYIIVIALFTLWSSAASSVIEFDYILILTLADEIDSPPYCQNKQSRHPRGLKISSCDQNISK